MRICICTKKKNDVIAPSGANAVAPSFGVAVGAATAATTMLEQERGDERSRDERRRAETRGEENRGTEW